MSTGRGIILVSGGLDSILAARILMDQDLEITGFHCILPFVAPDVPESDLMPVRLAARMQLPVHAHRCGTEYIDIIRNPAHGYGKRANPCIDCHIYFIKKAAEFMKEQDADFVATGEVVSQRPMSQMKHTMNHIEKAAGLQGRLLRPLSAKLLKPTIPETEGVVNRDLLLDLNGRSRKAQFELARKYAITDFASPSGGCLFTDEFIAKRVHDLIGLHTDVQPIDFYLLTIGRHFRLGRGAKIIVSRNEHENSELLKYRETSDYFFIPEYKGPAIYVKGTISEHDMDTIGSVILRYGKPEGGQPVVTVYRNETRVRSIAVTGAIPDEYLERLRI